MRITRRDFLMLLAEGAASLGILKVASLIPPLSQVDIVRPPGAVKEESFKALCVRCGICLEVCPTKAIVLADHWDGLEAVDTPKIDATFGPCEFYRGRCDQELRCSRFCPTGALRQVAKQEVKMGTVEFNSEKCLAFMGKECVVCDEMCPVPEAITLDEHVRPVFHGEECVGCGICVYDCPANPKALSLRSTGAKRVNA